MMTAADKAKLWMAAILIIAAVYLSGYALASETAAARLGVLIGGCALAVLIVAFSASGRIFAGFVKASGVELRKVIWPSRQETGRMTGIVLLLVLAIMLFLWLVDVLISSMLDVLVS